MFFQFLAEILYLRVNELEIISLVDLISPDMFGERAGFNNERWDLEFLDLIDRDPERLANMTLEDYMRLGGNEGAEVIMWLIMRGALSPTARKRHQNYYLPMTTAMAVALFE